MLVALEGSSPTIDGENNRKYYVWDAFTQTKQLPKIYEGGPATVSMTGSPVNIRTMANKATSFIKSNSGQIFLIGWSRGAAACIQVALDLKRSGFNPKINAMFLFDAVDRDTSTGDFLDVIPNNVINVYHARATGKGAFWGSIFRTCANSVEDKNATNLVPKDFNTSHGGVAGTEGTAGDAGSKAWMWANMKKEGVI